MDFIWEYGKQAHFEDAAAIRIAVFVEEQGYMRELELDAQDATSWHVVGYLNNVPVCTARIYTTDDTVYHVGRVAVSKDFRKQKLGYAMMLEAERKAKELGANKLILDAQSDKTYFYEFSGFTATGNTSLEEGQPHTEMEKTL